MVGLCCFIWAWAVCVIIIGLKLDPVGSMKSNQGTKLAHSEIQRTMAANHSNNIPRVILWYFLDVGGPELPIFQSFFMRTKSDNS